MFVATGPMNDPSSISASRAFSWTLSITSAEKFAALVHAPLTFEAVPLAKSTISFARFWISFSLPVSSCSESETNPFAAVVKLRWISSIRESTRTVKLRSSVSALWVVFSTSWSTWIPSCSTFSPNSLNSWDEFKASLYNPQIRCTFFSANCSIAGPSSWKKSVISPIAETFAYWTSRTSRRFSRNSCRTSPGLVKFELEFPPKSSLKSSPRSKFLPGNISSKNFSRSKPGSLNCAKKSPSFSKTVIKFWKPSDFRLSLNFRLIRQSKRRPKLKPLPWKEGNRWFMSGNCNLGNLMLWRKSSKEDISRKRLANLRRFKEIFWNVSRENERRMENLNGSWKRKPLGTDIPRELKYSLILSKCRSTETERRMFRSVLILKFPGRLWGK